MRKAIHTTTMAANRRTGYTLVELIVTIAIVAVVAAIAMPNMSAYSQNNRIGAASQEMLRSVQNARSEATRRATPVVICASPNPNGTAPVCSGALGERVKGWITFVDANSNWRREPANKDELLLEAHAFDDNQLTVGMDNSLRVSFGTDGFPRTNGGAFPQQNTTAIVIVDKRGNVDANGQTSGGRSVARGLVIATTGRARTTYDIDEITTLCSKTSVSECTPH